MTKGREIVGGGPHAGEPLHSPGTPPPDDLTPDPAALSPEAVSGSQTLRAFGVEYRHIHTREGGDLYLTPFGWPKVAHLLPECWYKDQWFARNGLRLPGSTGTVYRVETRPVGGRTLDLVAKFSRVAREVPIVVDTTFPEHVAREAIETARFNSPFEEFGLVMELRRGAFGPDGLRVRTQHPLAIYAPPEKLELWRLGRDECRFRGHRSLLAQDQEHAPKAIEMDIRRDYVMLYGWIKGTDAETIFEESGLTEQELHDLSERVAEELGSTGFRVLDNKPKHFVLRRSRRDGRLLRSRDGRLQYGLVDFELLQRTPDYQRFFKTRQRRRYWFLRKPEPVTHPLGLPSNLEVVNIFGTTYLFGPTPDGGRIWLEGTRPELFDYFLPDRWRRTPRLDLSTAHETYRTRTRDGVDLVYRRSRVGILPRSDLLEPNGGRIREHGFNSPFEEVAIAERLRQMGVPTTRPRAIFRTAHTTTKAPEFPDDRRYRDHADLVTPERPPEPLLSRNHDYYTIWDRYFGAETGTRASAPRRMSAGSEVWLDLEAARDEGLLPRELYDRTLEETRSRLRRVGNVAEHLGELDLACRLAEDVGAIEGPTREGPTREESSAVTPGVPVQVGTIVDLKLVTDAFTAWELGALSEDSYRRLVARVESKLHAADCEKLDLRGRHLLLTMSPDGAFEVDDTGEPLAVLCSFELIRGLYRKIR